MTQDNPIQVPKMEELALLYRQALESNNTAASEIADAAIMQLAAGEALIADAAVLQRFAELLSK